MKTYTHFTQDHNCPPHRLTAFHYTSLPIFQFPALLEVSSPRFKSTLFSSPIITSITLFIEMRDLHGEVASSSAGSSFQFDCPI